jgi:hypothetical protein
VSLRRIRGGWAAIASILLLYACALPVPETRLPAAPAGVPAEFPEAYYRGLLVSGTPVFRIDPVDSLVVIEVRRSGSLARLGHDHVVASHDLAGYVAPGVRRGDLYVALRSLKVDEAALRSEAGFDTQPSQSDIAGTRANMLDKVLEADKFPFALVRVNADSDRSDAKLAVTVTLHGVTRSFQAPAKIVTTEDTIEMTGRLAFDQTDFGITPYSLLGGAIAVQNRIDLRYRVRARRVSGSL